MKNILLIESRPKGSGSYLHQAARSTGLDTQRSYRCFGIND